MEYVGLNTQIWKNNIKSTALLVLFPVLIFILVWLFLFFIRDQSGQRFYYTNYYFLRVIPWVSGIVFLWLVFAYLFHSAMIRKATGSVPLARQDNKRVYNLVENACIGSGMKMPKINLIEDDSLNAFASGISESNYTISLSRGIVSKLNDEELEAVIAHELTHIKNRDVRLLIISIIFVGIFSFVTQALFRIVQFGDGGKGKKGGGIILIALLMAAIGFLISSIFRFAISQQREYIADAGSAAMTRNPLALASALEKISRDSCIEAVSRKDVAQLFIDNPQAKQKNGISAAFAGIFATHPPIERRIEILKQF
jgi:heat shock protein HtpX